MKQVRFIWLFLMAVGLSATIGSCSDNKQQKIDDLNKQIDSLRQENSKKDGDMKDMMDFVGVLADGLDSIAKQENTLFYSNKGKEGTIVDKEQLRKNLEVFEKTLETQKKRISQLVDSLKAKGESLSKLTSLVTYLNQQLDEKNNVIQSLRADLENKNVNIVQLQEKVNTLSKSNTELNEKVEKQVKALTVQSEMINEGYIKIGTKKQLTELGIVSGGFLKKTKVNYDAIKKGAFMRVDIRQFTEMTIESGDPKILTQMPKTSYKIIKNGKTSTLYVIDPTAFWSISNFLIIQTK